MEVRLNNDGRFIRLFEFSSNCKSPFLEGEKGNGWEKLKQVISSMVLATPR